MAGSWKRGQTRGFAPTSVMKRLIRVLMLLVGAMGAFVVGVGLEVWVYAERDETRPAGAAIVLGAAVFGNRPSPVLRERINHAVGLYNDGMVDKIIFTGAQGQAGESAESVVSRDYAMRLGVPAGDILIETKSTTTWENLIYAQEVAEENGIDTFLIVSTPFHMRRAMGIAEQLGMEAYTSPTRSTQWISWRTKTRAYLREVGGYLYYLAVETEGN